jgi:NAD(P) transhydrogenase subunit alpha
MQIGIPIETADQDKRVSGTPTSVEQFIKFGFSVVVQKGAGAKASIDDALYEKAGATLVEDDVWQSDIVLKVNAPSDEEIGKLKEGATLISFIWPAQNEELMKKLAERKINVLAMDAVPRISRAQAVDALSSMAGITGYRAVIEASHEFGRFLVGQITAAGKVKPAKVMVIGAGVAGLAAIGTANSLGAIVRAFDTRPEVKEQIESMGASFLEVDMEEESGSGDGYAKVMSEEYIKAEMALFLEQAKEVDIIISTAAIPGKPAPKLIDEEMVKAMATGSVIVDLAAASGGNCELTVPGEMVEKHGVKIIGYTDFASRLPGQASLMYGNNLANLFKLLCKEKNGEININFEDEVIRGMTIVKEGEITWPPPPVKVSAAPAKPASAPVKIERLEDKKMSPVVKNSLIGVGALLFLWVGSVAPAAFLTHMTVFVLAVIVGYHIIWNVTAALHTPLMSVTNAISGIIVVGALLQISSDQFWVVIIAFLATLIATINIAGGFFVTRRMLEMFRK